MSKVLGYVIFHLQPIVKWNLYCVQDTSDFLRKVDAVKSIPGNVFLVFLAVKFLYTSIEYWRNKTSKGIFWQLHQQEWVGVVIKGWFWRTVSSYFCPYQPNYSVCVLDSWSILFMVLVSKNAEMFREEKLLPW